MTQRFLPSGTIWKNGTESESYWAIRNLEVGRRAIKMGWGSFSFLICNNTRLECGLPPLSSHIFPESSISQGRKGQIGQLPSPTVQIPSLKTLIRLQYGMNEEDEVLTAFEFEIREFVCETRRFGSPEDQRRKDKGSEKCHSDQILRRRTCYYFPFKFFPFLRL